jgi:hypothetical protein
MVTVTGIASTGVFPLTYRWTQRAGPPVTVTPNNGFTAQSTFVAPAVGNVVELALVVVDQLGVSSQPSLVRIGVGGPPVARFVPDGGLVAGGQLLPLTSTSFDDAGLPIVAYDWQLVSGSAGVLSVDGGTATWRAPAVAFGAPDELGGVSLSVTNSIGVRSNTFTQLWTVRGANPNNWSLDAGVSSPMAVGRPTPTVVLRSAVSTSVTTPQFSLAWSCSPSLPLISPNGPAPQFIAPVIVGADVPVTCQVVATGQAPLDPPTLSRSVAFVLRDAADPQVVSSSLELARAKPFGYQVTGDEPLTSGTTTGGCSSTLPLVVGRSVMFGYRNTALPLATCAPVTVSLTDAAAPTANTSPAFPVGPSNNTVAQFVWTGPFESTDTFDDPRPVVASLGVLPEARQRLFGADPMTTPGFELLATQGGQLIRFSGIDLSAQPACSPTCPLASTPVLSGLAPGASPRGTRVSWTGAELLVATSTDGGPSPTFARRSPTGTWSTLSGVTGTPAAWDSEPHSVRVSGTDVLVDVLTTDLQTVRRTEVAATAVTQVAHLESTQDRVFIVAGPTNQLFVRERNPSLLTWSTRTTTFSNVSTMLLGPGFGGVQFLGVEHGTPASLTLLRVDLPFGFGTVRNIGVVEGYDVFTFGSTSFLVFGSGGDVRFQAVRADPLAGGSGFTDFGGPPRPGFSAPFPVMLDTTASCEAAWPRFSFVNEVLVITWQERCAPATRWKVMARVLQ